MGFKYKNFNLDALYYAKKENHQEIIDLLSKRSI